MADFYTAALSKSQALHWPGLSPPSTRLLAVCGISLAMILPNSAFAGTAERTSIGEAEVARCIRQAARGQKWMEKTLWGLRDQEGGWIGAEIKNRDGSHDLGPLQINSWWVPKIAEILARPPAQIRIWLRDEPCFNVEAARWIFTSTLASSQDYWRAIGDRK
ncbi:murein transglycosylase [Sphingobium sp.]|uniref:murein transglycosylase n=1 Tax=Sphingobium sp. TaxID=1912891 RepID=UPI0025801CC3|nr:murein transglycosylase [Sphingobium sp.]